MQRRRKIISILTNAAVFIILEIAAVAMLRNNGTLQSIWISRASHQFMAWTWGGSESIRDFFKLKKINNDFLTSSLSSEAITNIKKGSALKINISGNCFKLYLSAFLFLKQY